MQGMQGMKSFKSLKYQFIYLKWEILLNYNKHSNDLNITMNLHTDKQIKVQLQTKDNSAWSYSLLETWAYICILSILSILISNQTYRIKYNMLPYSWKFLNIVWVTAKQKMLPVTYLWYHNYHSYHAIKPYLQGWWIVLNTEWHVTLTSYHHFLWETEMYLIAGYFSNSFSNSQESCNRKFLVNTIPVNCIYFDRH